MAEFYQTFTVEYIQKYIFTTTSFDDLKGPAMYSFLEFVSLMIKLSKVISLLFFYLILFLAKFLVFVFPYALKLTKIVYEFHKNQLTVYDMAIEFTGITMAILVYIFRKQIVQWFKAVEADISAKSKWAAKAFPHFVFFGTAIVFAILGRKFIIPFTSPTIMPIFTLLFPLVKLIQLNYHSSPKEDKFDKKYLDRFAHCMTLWVVLAVYHAIATLLSTLHAFKFLLNYLPYLKELIIIIILWLQISPSFTDIIFSSIIFPIMQSLSKYIPTTSSSQTIEVTSKANTFLGVIKFMRILNDEQIDIIRSIFKDSVVTILAIVFIFLPTPIAMIGVVVIGLLLPAFRSIEIIQTVKNRSTFLEIRSPESITKNKELYLKEKIIHWLCYWICAAGLWIIRIYFMTIWPSIFIISCLYFQHSYFKGGSRLLENSFYIFNILIQRNQEIQKQKQIDKTINESSSEKIETEPRSIDSELKELEISHLEEHRSVSTLRPLSATSNTDITEDETSSPIKKHNIFEESKLLDEGPFSTSSPIPSKKSSEETINVDTKPNTNTSSGRKMRNRNNKR